MKAVTRFYPSRYVRGRGVMKELGNYAGLPLLICPTTTSTDAPCSAFLVLYTQDSVYKEVLFEKSNPGKVLMDTEIISKSPLRLTVSVMGNAIATYFEARTCLRTGADNFANGKIGVASYAIARTC